MKRRIIELGKDVLIAILVVAILVLTVLALPTETLTATPWLSKLLRPFAGVLGLSQAELTYTEKAVPALDAAQPLTISLRNTAGRYSCRYDFSLLDSTYETLGSTLGQALDTAQELTQTTRTKLYTALEAPSAMLWYPAALPVEVLGTWLGVETQLAGCTAEILALSVQNETVRLYLVGEECWVCDTQIAPDALLQTLDSFRPDGSRFAFEDTGGLYKNVAPLSLISAENAVIYTAAAQNPCDSRFIMTLASTMGFNPYGDTSYTDASGNAFFTETDCALSVSSAGELRYENSADTRLSAPNDADESVIETARSLLELLCGDVMGSARLYLSSFTKTEDGAICCFDYMLSGIPVLQQGSEHAAYVRFTGSTITELTLRIKTYTLLSQPAAVMPAAQTAAIVKSGTLLRICYDDAGTGELSAGWRADG